MVSNLLLLHTEFTFDSCHHLEGYDGKCKNKHGHSWLCEVWFKGNTLYKDRIGILVDFGLVKEIREKLDHNDLNIVLNFNPTAENLSEWVYNELRNKIKNELIHIRVRVYESYIDKKCWCEFGDTI
jgi:6-pyruvoyltetrahydropterin/6-carboxytetrahydropterin synthase